MFTCCIFTTRNLIYINQLFFVVTKYFVKHLFVQQKNITVTIRDLLITLFLINFLLHEIRTEDSSMRALNRLGIPLRLLEMNKFELELQFGNPHINLLNRSINVSSTPLSTYAFRHKTLNLILKKLDHHFQMSPLSCCFIP